jgi:hypothetical protein
MMMMIMMIIIIIILIQDKPPKKKEGDREWDSFVVNMNGCTSKRVELLEQKAQTVFVHPH